MNKKHLIALAITALIAISGAAEAGAQPSTHFPLSPMSQENAVRKAQEYLNYTAFSRQGLITQLVTEEQFSAGDATSAVDSLNVDWNEQAAKKAKDYLNYTAFSHASLVNQLIEEEKFTPSQAAYGVNAVGL